MWNLRNVQHFNGLSPIQTQVRPVVFTTPLCKMPIFRVPLHHQLYMMTVFLYIDKTDYFLDKTDVILYNIYRRSFSGYNGLIKRGEEKNMVYTADELQETVRSAQPGQTILLAPGVYRTKLLITTPGLTIRGAGADKTILVWDDYAKKLDEQGREYITFRTWTVAVCADGVTMEDLAIVNDAGHPEEKGQEVALTVYSDLFTMSRCRLALHRRVARK